MQLRKAGRGDAPALTDLINRAFRVERFYAVGDRITVKQVEEHLDRGEFYVLEDEGALAGCVYVELRGERAYFGLLSIDPARQRRARIAAAGGRRRPRPGPRLRPHGYTDRQPSNRAAAILPQAGLCGDGNRAVSRVHADHDAMPLRAHVEGAYVREVRPLGP